MRPSATEYPVSLGVSGRGSGLIFGNRYRPEYDVSGMQMLVLRGSGLCNVVGFAAAIRFWTVEFQDRMETISSPIS